MLRPSDLSLTGTFHASTMLTHYCTDSFSMFGVVGAAFRTNLIANSLLFDIVGLPLTGSKTVAKQLIVTNCVSCTSLGLLQN